MSFNLGWPAKESAPAANGHLRIKDLARKIEAGSMPHADVCQGALQAAQLRSSYDISLRNIDDNIYAVAAAIAALDRVETKLFEARSQIEDLCRRNQPIDLAKVERTLCALADHINKSVRGADENYVNMLRDSRLQIRISELGGTEPRAKQIDLTLISLDKLIAWKLRSGPTDPLAWIDLIEQMRRVASQNVQILSSIVLPLLAARDYTSEVVDLVMAPSEPALYPQAIAAAGEGTGLRTKTANHMATLAPHKKVATLTSQPSCNNPPRQRAATARRAGRHWIAAGAGKGTHQCRMC